MVFFSPKFTDPLNSVIDTSLKLLFQTQAQSFEYLEQPGRAGGEEEEKNHASP